MTIYKYCSGNTTQTVTVSMVAGACNYDSEYQSGGDIFEVSKQTLTFTLNHSINTTLLVNYTYTLTQNVNGSNTFLQTIYSSVSIPAGLTHIHVEVICSETRYSQSGANTILPPSGGVNLAD